MVRDLRIGPIGGQLQAFGKPGQRVRPVVQLGGDAAVAVVHVTEMCALPKRVVDVLHRQRCPVGGLSRAAARVGDSEVTRERGDRPTVGGDVVHGDHQHVFVVADGEKLGVQGAFVRQVEGMAGGRLHALLQPVLRPPARVDDVAGEPDSLGGNHHLLRDAVGRSEHRAQTFVAAHDVGQRRGQRVGVEVPAQPQRHGDVVHR
ncbi:hypothetical protein MMARJ_10940 [Mycobacterium marseillense]|uniref:Uncharacterized protein n=1 Tax=Mycobacterium marseillense TaxID=701042 RepID=A0ABM7J964_9MYCO|nr:hypothetical protein MMARJ_10940 [Mycobacterium marseillense]